MRVSSSNSWTTWFNRARTRARVLLAERQRAQAEAGVGHVGDCRETVPGDVTDRETEATVGLRHRGVPVAADDGRAGGRDVPGGHV